MARLLIEDRSELLVLVRLGGGTWVPMWNGHSVDEHANWTVGPIITPDVATSEAVISVLLDLDAQFELAVSSHLHTAATRSCEREQTTSED